MIVKGERRREGAVRVDLHLEISDLLFCRGNRVGAGDEAARRGLLARDGDYRPRELRGVAGLLPVL
jgi:hypothetical protein